MLCHSISYAVIRFELKYILYVIRQSNGAVLVVCLFTKYAQHYTIRIYRTYVDTILYNYSSIRSVGNSTNYRYIHFQYALILKNLVYAGIYPKGEKKTRRNKTNIGYVSEFVLVPTWWNRKTKTCHSRAVKVFPPCWRTISSRAQIFHFIWPRRASTMLYRLLFVHMYSYTDTVILRSCSYTNIHFYS